MAISGQIPDGFHQMFASWIRIEPRCRSDDFSAGLEARIADPLWMLARQWQIGEFQGEDNGSPIQVGVTYNTNALNAVELGKSGVPIELRSMPPLETMVERETVDLDWRTRVQIGQQFERLLRGELGENAKAVICTYRKQEYFPVEYPSNDDLVEIDYATRRFLRLMSGRAIDGDKLLTAIREGSVPTLPTEISADSTKIETAMQRLLAWYDKLYTQPGNEQGAAWNPQQLDYQFKAHASNGNGASTTIVAPEYRNGEFDWYTCLIGNEVIIDPGETSLSESYTPTRVTFAGMPHRRWWQIEANDIDFGDQDIASTDLVKLMLMEFALVYGDDWFMIPLPLPIGSVTRIEKLAVTNVFGETKLINPGKTVGESPLDRWEMFTLSYLDRPSDASGGDFLFLPPSIGFREESAPIEEVHFLRDEGANMVWAVEHIVRNKLGNPVQGFEAQTEKQERMNQAVDVTDEPPPDYETPEGVLKYRLASTVPDNWIPFVPVNAALSGLSDANEASIRLRQARMLRIEDDEEPTAIEAMTRIINANVPDQRLEWLNEEAVPRTGVKVQLTRQRARWIDGKTYVWLGRKVASGRGEGSSGLKFDITK